MERINHTELRVALARVGSSKRRLARDLGIAPSTLSGWVLEYATPPSGWVARVESALGVKPGSLRLRAEPRAPSPYRPTT